MIDHIPLEDLSARLDDALPPTRCAQIDAHVAVCDACRSELASLQWTVRFLRAMPAEEVPAPAAFHVGAATAYAAGAGDDTDDNRDSWTMAGRAWAAFGAIAALFVVAFGLSRMVRDPLDGPAPAPDAASVASDADTAQVVAGGAGPGYGVDVGTGTPDANHPDVGEAPQGSTVGPPPPPGVEVAAATGAQTEPAAGEGGGANGSDPADPKLQAVLRQTADAAVGREDDNARDPRPLATALGDDRSRRVAGIRAATATPAGGGAGVTPGAVRELGAGATSGVTSTMATPPAGADPAALGAEAGGYVPPDAPIPGIPRRPIVVPPAAVAPAGSVTATAAVSMTAPAATPMAVGAAVATDQADASLTPPALTSEGEAATPAPESGASVGPAAVVASPVAAPMIEGQPAAPGSLPAHLFVPVITVAIALLALGVILMRQAQARRRRYR